MRVKDYYKPTNLRDALQNMQLPGQVRALAGGTDIVIALRERRIEADALVDLSLVEELGHITLDSDGLHIGAMVRFAQLEQSALVRQHCPMLAQAASQVGSPQIRNRGTIGGNLVNAATAADTVPVLMAMDAVAVVANAQGSRVLSVAEIPVDLNRNCLASDELLTEIILPLHPNAQMSFQKIGRRKALAIARINLALLLELDDCVIRRAAVAYGAVGRTAYRVPELEAFLIGKTLSDVLIDAAAALADQLVAEALQGRKTTPYKRKIAAAVLRRALVEVKGGGCV